MNKNTKVTINRNEIAPALAALLPGGIWYNTGRIVKTNEDKSRYQVKIMNETFWFDAEAVQKVN